jgi:hypothetical protein
MPKDGLELSSSGANTFSALLAKSSDLPKKPESN